MPTRKPDVKHPNRYWGAKALPKSKAEFFDAITVPTPAGTGTVATVRMYGPIDSWGGYWGISAKDVGAILDALPDSVEQIILRINSPGGEVWEAVSILNMLRAHAATVTAVVDGLAASAASVIAAGCDEAVMSPGTQMMIHSPSSITWGNAREMRKTADVLDVIEASIIEIYAAKAGEQDWPTLLADETWLTAQQTADLGLADRVAVIPDAGETETVGTEDDELLVLPDEEDPEDSAARVVHIIARTPRLRLPSSTEPGEPRQKENAVAYSDLTAGLRKRLGVTDADASDETLLAALDEALAEQPTTTAAPDGAVIIDANAWAEVQAAAQDGRAARAEQDKTRRDRIVDDAVNDGRIPPASREGWRKQLDTDENGIKTLLAGFPTNTVPVKPLGHSDEPSADDSLYAKAFPDEKED